MGNVQVDTPLVQNVKALIRYTEATSAAGACGVLEQRCHFLSMPFYETGVLQAHALSCMLQLQCSNPVDAQCMYPLQMVR